MKRISALMLVLATLLCFAACGEKNQPAFGGAENVAPAINVADVEGKDGTVGKLSVYTNTAAGIEFRPANTEWQIDAAVAAEGTIATVMTADKGEAGSYSVDMLMELAPGNMELEEYAERVKAAFGDDADKWGEIKDTEISSDAEGEKISCVYIEKSGKLESRKPGTVNSKPSGNESEGGNGGNEGKPEGRENVTPGGNSENNRNSEGEDNAKPFCQRIVMYKTEKYFVSVIITSDSSSTNDVIQKWFKPYKELEKK